ncbi:uncharacterized protein LOC134574584 [Pelobates fuscus]|uniref:uncharacterized protein LOC134574584 n=1 Tax=Pelobates fuscus TaxID=191477 RepID=UPI002FE4C37A
MPGCFVHTCRNHTAKKSFKKDVMFHSFPSTPSRIKQWLQHIGQQQYIQQEFGDLDLFVKKILDRKGWLRVCSTHFEPESYSLCQGKRKLLKPNAVPTVFKKLNAAGIAYNPSVTSHPRSASFSFGDYVANQTSRRHMVMVDSSTSADITVCKEDKATQCPEFELNVYGEPWKIKNDHFYNGEAKADEPSIPIPPSEDNCHIAVSYWVANAKREWVPVPQESRQNNSFHYEISQSIGTRICPHQDTVTIPLVSSCKDAFPDSLLEQTGASSFTESVSTLQPSKLSSISYISECGSNVDINTSMPKDVSENDMTHERKFFVFESCLDLLLENVTCKYGRGCNSPLVDIEKHVDGT